MPDKTVELCAEFGTRNILSLTVGYLAKDVFECASPRSEPLVLLPCPQPRTLPDRDRRLIPLKNVLGGHRDSPFPDGVLPRVRDANRCGTLRS